MKQTVNYHRICPVCGSNFSTSDSRKIYCSLQCYKKAASLRNRAKSKSYHKTCPVCGLDFVSTDFRRIYCSDNCSYELKKAKENARHKAKHKKVELSPRPCIVCGKTFTPLKSNSKLICSEECKRIRVRAQHKVYQSSKQHSTHSTKQKDLAQKAHALRMQRQLEAKAEGKTYGQYVALLGGEFS